MAILLCLNFTSGSKGKVSKCYILVSDTYAEEFKGNYIDMYNLLWNIYKIRMGCDDWREMWETNVKCEQVQTLGDECWGCLLVAQLSHWNRNVNNVNNKKLGGFPRSDN